MPTNYAPPLECRVEIDAAPSQVWTLVRDVCRMAEWSPQVTSTRLRHGAEDVGLGVEFTNLNSSGEFTWITHGTIVRFEDQREIAFRIEENWAIWSFSLQPTPGGGTELMQRRETPDGISDLSVQSTETYLGGQEVFTEVLRDGMHQTLESIKSAVEAAD